MRGRRDPELRVAHPVRGVGGRGSQVAVELPVGCPSFAVVFRE